MTHLGTKDTTPIFSYDPATGLRLAKTYADVTNSAGRALHVSYAFAGGRDAGYSVTLPGGSLFERSVRRDPTHPERVIVCASSFNGVAKAGFAYAYDLLGRPVLRDNPGNTVDTFAYDARGQVVEDILATRLSCATNSYAYDGAGNRTASAEGAWTTSYDANALNQYTEAGDEFLHDAPRSCDAMGNVATYLHETGAEVASFTYDAFSNTLAASGLMADIFPFRLSNKKKTENP